jgi:hypothetical protein
MRFNRSPRGVTLAQMLPPVHDVQSSNHRSGALQCQARVSMLDARANRNTRNPQIAKSIASQSMRRLQLPKGTVTYFVKPSTLNPKPALKANDHCGEIPNALEQVKRNTHNYRGARRTPCEGAAASA